MKYDGAGFTHFTTSDGLVDKTVKMAFADSKGNTWFVADSGVCKYDGNRLMVYKLPGGLPFWNVRSMFEDSHGGIWFVTNTGILRYLSQN